jgi:hypothetical protein
MELSTTSEANSFPALHGTRSFSTEFTRAFHLFLHNPKFATSRLFSLKSAFNRVSCLLCYATLKM